MTDTGFLCDWAMSGVVTGRVGGLTGRCQIVVTAAWFGVVQFGIIHPTSSDRPIGLGCSSDRQFNTS